MFCTLIPHISAAGDNEISILKRRTKRRRLLLFGPKSSIDFLLQSVSPVPTTSSERNQVEQTKCWFINQNRIAYTGL